MENVDDLQPRPRRQVCRPIEKQDDILQLLDDSEIEDVDDEDSDPTVDLSILERDQATHDNESDDNLSSDEEDQDPMPEFLEKRRKPIWKHTEIFEPLPPAPIYIPESEVTQQKKPLEYFEKYIPMEIFETMAFCMNVRYLKEKGHNLNTSAEEIKKFIGRTLAITCLKFPRIRMFWSRQFRIPIVADTLQRDRFFLLRNNMKLVIDEDISEEKRQENRFWKIQPLIDSVRNACLSNERTTEVSLDEQMVPFWGKSRMRQYVKGKPNPCGLKIFAMTTPDGVPLDFFFYEGKSSTIKTSAACDLDKLNFIGKVVMKLSETLPPGCTIYMDRLFGSELLFDILFSNGITATGTLMKNKIPNGIDFIADKQLKRSGRGSSDMVVRSDELMTVVKWFDNKPVLLFSTKDGVQPTDTCERWDKKRREFIEVIRPSIVKKYNEKMGGVDFLDRVISYYRMHYRTKKWTVRAIHHLIDFSIAAAWIEYRLEQKQIKQESMDYFNFRMDVAEHLVYTSRFSRVRSPLNDVQSIENQNPLMNSGNTQQKKRETVTQHPPVALRKRNLDHLPVVLDGSPARCRFPGCKSNVARMFCSTCNVTLCLNSSRNCYKAYHEM